LVRMQRGLLPLCLVLALAASALADGGDKYCPAGQKITQYNAAALEYELDLKQHYPEGRMLAQAKQIRNYTRAAKEKGVDILVLPEAGLTHREEGEARGVEVPKASDRIVICSEQYQGNKKWEVLYEYSCAAKESNLYLVVSLAELTREGRLFNTLVVFDRQGALIKRYRKTHNILDTSFTNGPKKSRHARFTTDFGVNFTMMVSLDMLFKHPTMHNIKLGYKNVLMATSWIDVAPYSLAPSMFSGYAKGNGVNLIVAGKHNPARTKLGSGVFLAEVFKETLVPAHTYTYDPELGAAMVVAPVATCVGKATRTPSVIVPEPSIIELEDRKRMTRNYFVEDMSNFTMKKIDDSKWGYVSVKTQEGLGCVVIYRLFGSRGEFALAAYSGQIKRSREDKTISLYHEICIVVWCPSKSITDHCGYDGKMSTLDLTEAGGSFEWVELEMTRPKRRPASYVMPAAMSRSLELVQVDKASCDKWGECTADFGPSANLLSASLIARFFRKDET